MTIDIDPTELMETTNAIENVMDKTEFSDVIIQGDLNWDDRRQSGHSVHMREFIQRIGLKSVWEKYPVNFTHVHTDLKSTSMLDNFLVNERLLEYIEDAGVMHLGDNLSRHSPIMLKLRVGQIPLKQLKESTPKPRRPTWYKATDQHLDSYADLVHDRLADLGCPESLGCDHVCCSDPQHKVDRDNHMLDVLSNLIESSHLAIPLTKPNGKVRREKDLPGWKEHFEPFRSDAQFWHSIWLSLSRPNTGHLYSVMCWSRNKYHYAVRKLKKNKVHLRAEELLEASESGDIDLMAAMKVIKGKKNTGQTMPDSVEAETESETILDKFKEVYQLLYNSAGTAEAMKVIKTKLQNLIIGDSSLLEINRITAKVVK